MSEALDHESLEGSEQEDVSAHSGSEIASDVESDEIEDDSEDDSELEDMDTTEPAVQLSADIDPRIEKLGRLYEEANQSSAEEEDDEDNQSLGSLEDDELDGLLNDADKFEKRQVRKKDGESQKQKELREAQMRDLEKLVFGDPDAVRSGLANFNLEDDAGTTGMEGMADADLFFVDDDGDANTAVLPTKAAALEPPARPAAWDDSDDERITINLNQVKQLRKLRTMTKEEPVNGAEYSRRLRQQYELLSPRPQWAVEAMEGPAKKRRRLSQDDSDSDLDDNTQKSALPLSKLIRDASALTRTTSKSKGRARTIRPETINIQRSQDVPSTQSAAVTSLNFHPSYPILLSSGPSAMVSMHHITPSPPAPAANPLLISLKIRGSPLHTTTFCPNDSRIFMSAQQRHFHVWDLESGRVERIKQQASHGRERIKVAGFKISPDGKHIAIQGSGKYLRNNINIVSTTTLQWLAEVRVEGKLGISDFLWWSNSEGLTILASNGEVTEWSVSTQKVVARWQDEGAVNSTTLAFGGQHSAKDSPIGNDRWLAIGSSAGIVNVYDRRALLSSNTSSEQCISEQPKPVKSIDNITTAITTLTFSPDGQVLAMASKAKKDALRLVHLPSATVFRNWPTDKTPLGRVTAVAFADGNNMTGDAYAVLAVANKNGQIRMWEIY